MSFDYNQSIWGQDTASLKPSHPTAIRLFQSLKLLKNLSGKIKILEVGCGAGQFIRSIKQSLPTSECYGFDVSEAAINKAKDAKDAVNYLVGPADHWPLGDNFFDAVVIYDVLEHVESVGQTMIELKRVLKPGGLVYAFIPCEGDYLSFWRWLKFSEKFDTLTNKYAGHINRFSRAHWQKIFNQSGFDIAVKKYSEHFFGQLLGVLAFYLMDRRAKNNNLSQLNNEEYFGSLGKKSKFKKLLAWARILVNSLIYWESIIFQDMPSPNMHLVAQKMK
ncbi:MAG: class I SAM-dependent methyltransferase [Candidatus Magasanikbacteria bacterium]|nr:class I SAM-dependent methyltransferase [Candidatus Magasanikbacteria bacterium]